MAVDGSVPCPQQRNSTTTAANSNHELPASSRAGSSQKCDHVLIKWHDSWLNHVLISQLPWLHELSSISNGLDIWPSLLALCEWVLQRQDRWEKCDFRLPNMFRRYPLSTDLPWVELKYYCFGALAVLLLLHQVLHNPGFLCSVQNVRGIRNELNWIQLEWKGHKDQPTCEASLSPCISQWEEDWRVSWPISGQDITPGQRSGWLAEIDLERKRLSDVCNHKMQIRAIYWVILEHNIWIISHNALQ